jgi:hypothetical protein
MASHIAEERWMFQYAGEAIGTLALRDAGEIL